MHLPVDPRASLSIRAFSADDRAWAAPLLQARWGSARIVSRGQVHDLLGLPGFVAEDSREPVGLATYRLQADECQLTSLDAVNRRQGIGTALLQAVRQAAEQAGCRRLWLVTTNDNLEALRFYQRRGLRLAAVHAGVLDQSRRLKPEIPAVGEFGIPLRDEIEMDTPLGSEAA